MIQEVIVYTIIAIFIGISQSAGIGGGPILNICLMLGLGYDTKDSMSITYIFLMGGAFASMWKCKDKKNTKTGGPLIDYNLVLLTLPGAISGSIFGTILNHYISDFIITILFSILLSYLAYNSYEKIRAIQRLSALQNQTNPLIEQIQMKDVVDHDSFSTNESSNRLKQIIEYQKNPYPKDKFKIIGEVFMYTLLVLLFKGGSGYDSIVGIDSCSLAGWFFILLHIMLTYLYTKSIAIKQYKLDAQKQSLGYVFENEKEKVNQSKMNSCMVYGFLAGTVGGALGLGGAIILVPVWLNKGIDKNIAVSSSPPIIFFSALVSFTLGILSLKYSSLLSVIFYFVLAFIGSYVIKQIVNYISEKYNLKTMIFILLIITMVSSLVTLLPYQFAKFIEDPQDFMAFGTFC